MEPLQKRGFNFKQRGETYVKGFKNKVNFTAKIGVTCPTFRSVRTG